MRFRALALSAVLLVLSSACGDASTTTLDRSSGGDPAGAGDPSRDSANDSRPGADVPEDAPANPPAEPTGPLFRAVARPGKTAGGLASFTRDEAALEADGTLVIAAGKGHPGTDPQPTGYHGGSFYNGGSFRYAVVKSPEWQAKATFDRLVPSFEALTPPGTWITIKASARIGGAWTKDFSLGVWAFDESTIRRHSVEGQADDDGDVATDTLVLNAPADALRMTVLLFSEDEASTPRLRAVSAIATTNGVTPKPLPDDTTVWGKSLAVPKRSQMIYPGGGEVWCSPTSTSMLLAYWGIAETPPQAAKRCHDVVYGGTGNWPFNTAHAAAIDGGKLHALVTRLSSFAQIEALVAAEIPVAITVRYAAGQLTGSPISSTAGHLLVVKGFSKTGDVVVNDPAFGSDASVETTYDRAELASAWRRSGSTAYVVWPMTKTLPVDPLGAY